MFIIFVNLLIINYINMNSKQLLLLSSLYAVSFTSCVDKNYDLEKLDTDNIVIGDQIIAPLGNGTLSLDKMLNIEDVKEITVDKDGNYTASYEDEMVIEMPADIKLKDFNFEQITFSLNSIPEGGPLLSDQTIVLGENNMPIVFDPTNEVKRIDTIYFNTENNKSIFCLNLKTQSLEIQGESSTALFRIAFPIEYIVNPKRLTQSDTWDQKTNTLIISRSIIALKQGISLDFEINKAVVNANTVDAITYETSFNFKKGTTILSASNALLIIDGKSKDLNFQTIYGEFEMNFSAEQGDIEMGDFNDIFDGNDNNLSFTNTHITLTTNSNIGIPIVAQLNLTATAKDKTVTTEINPINITPASTLGSFAQNNIWIAATKEGMPEPFSFTENKDLNNLIRIMPNNIVFDLSAKAEETGKQQFFTSDAQANVKYAVKLPFAPATDFRANVIETVKDVFDGDMIDYLFSSGSATIYGEVLNSIPLNMEMQMVIVNGKDEPVGITLTPQAVAGSANNEPISSAVSFEIKESDMPKMVNAKHINLVLTLTSDDALAGKMLNQKQSLDLKLKIKKTGGIAIE